jgi:hypothetical protein
MPAVIPLTDDTGGGGGGGGRGVGGGGGGGGDRAVIVSVGHASSGVPSAWAAGPHSPGVATVGLYKLNAVDP